MKKIISTFLLLAFFNISTPVLARTVKVNHTTKIPITFEQSHTSKNIEAGQKADGIIADDVKVNGVLVFKKGDKAYLNVSDVKKAGFIGNAGELHTVNGGVYDTRGNLHTIDFNRKYAGEEKTYPKVLLGASVFFLFPLALFGFVKGGQAKIKTGDIIDVNLRNDFIYDSL